MIDAPLLETARLALEPFAEAHLTARYVGWLNDPEVVRFSEQRHRGHDMESCRAFMAGLAEAGDAAWAIRHRGRHVGNLVAYRDRRNRVAELSILIGERDAWGGGLGTEAWGRAMAHLLDKDGMRRVEAGAMAENSGMMAIFRRTGMVEEGRRHGHFLLDGRPVDMVLVARDAGATAA